MTTHLELGGITVDVVRKEIKNIHLSVHPPTGKVRIAVPERMSVDTVRAFAISKLSWIKRQQVKLEEQERELPRDYIDRESHYLWGRRYLLKIVHTTSSPAVEIQHNRLLLHIKAGTPPSKRHAILDEWYRSQVREAANPMIAKWEKLIGVSANRVFIQRMKTKWGSCNHSAKNIRLNTDLAKKPRECLEYLIVHELLHLIEPTHNARFTRLLDQYMPKWQSHRELLNRLPVRHEDWTY